MIRRAIAFCAILLSVGQSASWAALTLTPSDATSIIYGLNSATVTFDLNVTNNDVPAQQVAFYSFSVNLSGPSITAISASYDDSSVWGGVLGLLHDPAPVIVENTVSFRAGGQNPLNTPSTDPFNISLTAPAVSRIGTITFTTLLNGDFVASTSQASTLDAGSTLPLFGFVQDQLFGGETQITQSGDFKSNTLTVSGITAVPEPSSMLLIASVFLGVGGNRVRSRLRRRSVSV